jgi:Tfp pilus assembly protein PilX
MRIFPELHINKKDSREEGFVLVAALLVMLVLTILGIATTTNVSLELQIAGNDKVHKRTFYGAEGGAVLGSELLEQNLNCATGFSAGAVAASASGNESWQPPSQIRKLNKDPPLRGPANHV